MARWLSHGAQGRRRLPVPLQKDTCKKTSVAEEGEVADEDIWSIDKAQITKEARYDGFYALCTSFDDDIETLLKVNVRR